MAEAIPSSDQMISAGAERAHQGASGGASARRGKRAPVKRASTSKPASSRASQAQAAAIAADSRNRWLELVLSVVQAPVGLAQSQTEFLVGQLEKTGNIGQREADRLLTELRSARERAQGRAEQEAGRLDRFIEGKIEDVLNRVNIPSRSDIERLNHSVDVLTAKVEALVSRQESPSIRGGTR